MVAVTPNHASRLFGAAIIPAMAQLTATSIKLTP